ncbi:Scarecrow-like protein 14 [Bienertia sinuspersici]
MGSQFGEISENGYQYVNGNMSPGYDESLNYANLFNYKDSSQDLTSLNFPSPISNQFPPNLSSFLGAKQGVELSDDSDDSDDVLKYISQMLMEEDMEQKPYGTTLNGSMMSSLGFPLNMGVFSEEESIIQFQKGMEEASKFLPKNNNFVIDLENIDFPNETKDDASVVVVKEEKGDNLPDMSRGSKVHYRGDDDANEDFEEGRSSKQSAVSVEEAELSEMFDRVLLCSNKPNDCTFNTNSEKSLLSHGSQSQGQERGKGRPRKQGNSNNVVDLRTLLILCAQSVASDDRRNADELLKQIREHSSSRLYTALRSKRTSAADMLKAYQFFIRTCPLKKISIGFANYMISEKVAEKASKLHVIDFGIRYGFQWPALIQRLSARDGGPPKLCITGIDLPQPGFRPAERVEATGRRLAKYCERFSVPFEYHAIAQKWETIRVEDLKIGSDEVVAVNCLYRFRNLLDETIMADSPRNAVLNLDPERLMFEKEFYGREIMNVVACEGTVRVERPETYKQWQAKITRAGFRQLPLDQDLINMLRCKVREIITKTSSLMLMVIGRCKDGKDG